MSSSASIPISSPANGVIVVLFSTDTDLTAEQIVDYYSLRFQIEFNFRDAKQHWGLENFMNVRQQTVTNAANIAIFMVNLATILTFGSSMPLC